MRQAFLPPLSAGVLNSWKEIALYVGRGVRTVQRWERDLGLPVHRPRGKQRSAVLAIPTELDAWIHNTPGRGLGELLVAREAPMPEALRARQNGINGSRDLREIIAQSRELRTRSVVLLRQLMDAAKLHHEGAARLANQVRMITTHPVP